MIHGPKHSIFSRLRSRAAMMTLALVLAGSTAMPLAAFEPGGSDPAIDAPESPSAELERKRNETRAELENLSKTIQLSGERSQTLQDEIKALEKSSASVRTAQPTLNPRSHNP